MAGTVSAQAAQPGGTLKAVVRYDVDTLDPITTKSFKTSEIAGFTYNRLLKYKTGKGTFADGTVEGDLAATWELPDPTTLLMKLRPGVKWDQRSPTNGRALAIEDVTLSWEKFASDSTYKGDLLNSASKDSSILSLKATDPTTIEIKTAFPDAQLLPVLAFAFDLWILPKEGLTGGFDPSTTMRGAGPWTLEKYQPSVGFSFKKNPNYYDAAQYPLLDSVEFPIVLDTAQVEAQFKAKNIQFGGAMPVTDILSINKDLAGTRIDLQPPDVTGPSISFSWRESNPFKDTRVRQAISMLLDRDTFINVFNDLQNFQAAGVKMRGYWDAPYGAGYGAYWLDPKSDAFGPSATNYKLNVAEAKKLLTAAGHPDGFDTPFTWVAGPTYGRDWDQRAEALMSMLAKGGIRAKANAIDYSSVWIPQYLRKQGDFDGLAMYPNGSRGDPGQWMGVFLSSAGANNQAAKNFPDLDALIDKQRREFDVAKRQNIFHDIQRYCAENLPIVSQGGKTEVPSLAWKGLHGPDQYYQWNGNPYSYASELFPYYWIDDSLRR